MHAETVEFPELIEAEKAWREAVAKYRLAMQVSIAADKAKPKGNGMVEIEHYNPLDAQHMPITAAGRECEHCYKRIQEIRARLGLPEFKP